MESSARGSSPRGENGSWCGEGNGQEDLGNEAQGRLLDGGLSVGRQASARGLGSVPVMLSLHSFPVLLSGAFKIAEQIVLHALCGCFED